ncbi:hypothetical protein HGRIS_013811 [Hohenbuehelia grisea]|uniref:Uncharacterized protein n=1 Tax=Hohenbuehelia grisea TaxID=104357 RepID=A0ABR3IWY3_9AGAR
MTSSLSAPSVRALSSKQERRLVTYLEDQFLELTRGYKKRSEPSTTVPTLPTYLEAAQKLLALVLQIPPIDPSTALRTAFLLRLTNDVLSSVSGYAPTQDALPCLLDWLDDLDQAWVAVLQSQVWDPESGAGTDLVVPVDDAAAGVRSSPVSQTERTRLKSLLLGAAANLEEWLAGMNAGEGGDAAAEDLEGALARLGLQESFDDLFWRTLQDLGALDF